MASVAASFCFKPVDGVLNVRAWLEDAFHNALVVVAVPGDSSIEVRDEEGVLVGTAVGAADPGDASLVRFDVPVQLSAEHAYRAYVVFAAPGPYKGHLPMPTVR